ncbi:LLM class flavin-dependent oxidoreductase [Nonomuraea diastatica]|uniref:LLM class flavin-dependent oxidoreductase n=1 Tax=Nonomuraea diastatica TaxID=1848329 RepID=A0A4V6PCY1_9ACTN|nr:LLM class flavin-dependent oxidoreductase [Nonomuraea diastatica]TDD15106.1 LLM class flavin-dependent oxidoreductase [Nonomuraea diastatica]
MHPIGDVHPADEAVEAERLGFDFVSVADHPFGGSPTNEPLVTLAAIGASTRQIGLVTRVLGAPFRNPALVAKMAETINRLANGRLVLGIGGGGADNKMRSVGINPPSARGKIDALAETTAIIKGMWSEGKFTFPGRHHDVADAEISPRPTSRIPIWLGVLGVRGAEVAGSMADGWIPYLRYTSVQRLTECRTRLFGAADRAGRDPSTITCVLSLEAHVGPLADVPANAVVGPPEAVADQLAKLRDLGFDGFNVSLLGPDRAEQPERFAQEVLPLLRQTPPPAGATASGGAG